MKRQRKTTPTQCPNHHLLPYELDFEAQKEDGFAALRLCSFKLPNPEPEPAEEHSKDPVLGSGRKRKLIGSVSPEKTEPRKHCCSTNWVQKSTTNQDKIKNNSTVVYRCPEIGMGPDGGVLPDSPPIPELKDMIGICSKPFEKQLTKSDLERSQNRLKFNGKYVTDALIPFLKDGENLTAGIPVRVFNSKGKEYSMKFKCWEKAYVLNGQWNKFVEDYDELMGANVDWVTVWMFRDRETDGLCFAVTSRRLDTKDLLRRGRKKYKC